LLKHQLLENIAKVALITGANKGIGYQIARQLGQQQITVLIGARNEQEGKAAELKLKGEGINAQFLPIDLDDSATISAAKTLIGHQFGKLDILINNAAFQSPEDQQPSEIPQELLQRFMHTNYAAHVLVTQSLLPMLKRSSAGRIVNMSTSLGSVTIMSEPGHVNARRNLLGYSSAKAALNMFTVLLAKELKATKIKVNSADPGWTQTDLGGKDAIQTPEEGARVAVWLACLDDNGPTGGFFGHQMVNPW
jgi:NAD(P)-dependent dehydrogenase (short-subunit alcohol dehydrogenase family)